MKPLVSRILPTTEVVNENLRTHPKSDSDRLALASMFPEQDRWVGVPFCFSWDLARDKELFGHMCARPITLGHIVPGERCVRHYLITAKARSCNMNIVPVSRC